MTQAVQLSCESCKKRKVKCDKGSPCSACKAAGITCKPVQRARLPRGRTGKLKRKFKAFEDRAVSLERLVSSLEGQVQQIESRNNDTADDETRNRPPMRYVNKIEELTARGFWVALSSEVSGLRETLEESDLEESEDEDEALTDANLHSGHYIASLSSHSILFPFSPCQALPVPTEHFRSTLLHIYESRVDPLFKILHWPSGRCVLDCTVNGKSEGSRAAAEQALQYAIYFLSICSTIPNECEELRLGDRSTLIQQYQQATETLLARANLLTSTNITLLQSFVLYIAGIRCSVNPVSAWSLVALAVRIADACGVSSASPKIYSEFDLELRRRLWFGISVLDSQTSFGRGSLPLLSYTDLVHTPSVLNDDEMSPEHGATESAHSFTDMSFASLIHQKMICQRKLIDPNFGDWQARLDAANAFELFATKRFGQFEFSADPLQRYTAFGARGISAAMHLLVRRPPYKPFANAMPPSDDFDTLEMACRVLQTGLWKKTSTEFVIFSWFAWPNWFALAVVLIELCGRGHGPKFDRAFSIAQESYVDYAQSAPHAHSWLFWKPITKLMRRAQRIKDAQLRQINLHRERSLHSKLQTSLADLPSGPCSVNVNDGLRPSLPADDLHHNDMARCDFATSSRLQWDDFLDEFNDSNLFASF